MSSKKSVDIRAVIFVNEAAHRAFEGLPDEVKVAADVLITALQNNRPLPVKRHDRLKGTLSGITELKIPCDSNTYRVYDLVEYEEVIYVLDAGMKKSNEKSEIPSWQVTTLEARKKAAKSDYAENEAKYKAEFEDRETRREQAQHLPKPRGL